MLQTIAFTGPITAQHLKLVHSFIGNEVALFMPVAGPCQLAVTPMHTHPAHLFVMQFSNSTSIVTQHQVYGGEANHISFVPAHLPHHEVNDHDLPRYIAIFVKPAFLQQQLLAYQPQNILPKGYCAFKSNENILNTAKRFIGECQSHQPGSELLLNAISVELVHHLLRAMFRIEPNHSQQAMRMEINRCIEFMRQNMGEKLTLPVLAAFANLSVSQFTRVFRQETGQSPIDYLIDLRLTTASIKLLAGNLPIKQIALDCGFSSPAHFSTAFVNKFNVNPSEYCLPVSDK